MVSMKGHLSLRCLAYSVSSAHSGHRKPFGVPCIFWQYSAIISLTMRFSRSRLVCTFFMTTTPKVSRFWLELSNRLEYKTVSVLLQGKKTTSGVVCGQMWNTQHLWTNYPRGRFHNAFGTSALQLRQDTCYRSLTCIKSKGHYFGSGEHYYDKNRSM